MSKTKSSRGAKQHNENGIKHGDRRRNYRSPEYLSWSKMRDRCLNNNHHAYARYGGRGICIDPAWDDYSTFLRDMGRKPSPSHSLDRYPDNDGDYTPTNCRWATKEEQGRNRCDNKIVEFNGKKQSVASWAAELNIPKTALYQRLGRLHWTIERAFTTPSEKRELAG